MHFVEGFKEAAEKFRMESGVQPSVDLDTLDERIKIREAIQNGQIQEAISLVNDIHPELLDNNRYLYFHLQVSIAIKKNIKEWFIYTGLLPVCALAKFTYIYGIPACF